MSRTTFASQFKYMLTIQCSWIRHHLKLLLLFISSHCWTTRAFCSVMQLKTQLLNFGGSHCQWLWSQARPRERAHPWKTTLQQQFPRRAENICPPIFSGETTSSQSRAESRGQAGSIHFIYCQEQNRQAFCPCHAPCTENGKKQALYKLSSNISTASQIGCISSGESQLSPSDDITSLGCSKLNFLDIPSLANKVRQVAFWSKGQVVWHGLSRHSLLLPTLTHFTAKVAAFSLSTGNEHGMC